jgi:hypothetical protein
MVMMNIARTAWICGITFALVAGSSSASAQPSRLSSTAIHEYDAADSLSVDVAIPSNLQFGPAYRALVESMLHRSSTFRRQCARIAAEPQLTVRLQPAAAFWTHGARAMTKFVRQRDGRILADVYLTERDDHVELIAHEFEHVIEQLDEIDLPSKALVHDSGVFQTGSEGGMFETVRASRVGLIVAREVRLQDRNSD